MDPKQAHTNADGDESDHHSDRLQTDSGNRQAEQAQKTAGTSGPDMDTLTRYLAIADLSGGWIKNLSALLFLELNRSFVSLKKSIALQLALLPMLLMLYLSICGAIGYIAYAESDSIYLGIASFVLLQGLFIAITCVLIKRFKAMIGFSNTREQLKEAQHDITSAFK